MQLPYIPERPKKPRNAGLTMMMDKGLSLRQVEDFIEMCAPYTDLVKFGFGTSVVCDNVKEKVALYKKAGIRPYLGGTLFEAYAVRNMVDDYLKLLDTYKLEMAEVSDGSMKMSQEEKLGYIQKLAKHVTVLSEVGSKQKGVNISDDAWIGMMKAELQAGSWKVICEARESGTIGIYNADGSANENLISNIMKAVNKDDILWEAPVGKQQVWFVKLLGTNVSLGNIAPDMVIPLECLRLGLRGDTFLDFLPDDIKKTRNPLL